jgi:hypothetical protein
VRLLAEMGAFLHPVGPSHLVRETEQFLLEGPDSHASLDVGHRFQPLACRPFARGVAKRLPATGGSRYEQSHPFAPQAADALPSTVEDGWCSRPSAQRDTHRRPPLSPSG